MRLLFEIDLKDYKKKDSVFVRPSSRAIIIKNNKVAMVHSLKYDYYKFPGGGIDEGESKIDALIRETKEEVGLIVIKESIKEFGMARRIENGEKKGFDVFYQDNYYYIVEVTDEIIPQNLDDYENEENFTLEFVDPRYAISINREKDHGPKSKAMIEREAMVLEILLKEGYIK